MLGGGGEAKGISGADCIAGVAGTGQKDGGEEDALKKRSNAEWIAALGCSKECNEALEDLRRVVLKGLRGRLGGDLRMQAWIEDFAQEALLRILKAGGGFRGESSFESWAVAVAIRIAQSELRKARWRDVPIEPHNEGKEAPVVGELTSVPFLMRSLRDAIAGSLTARQRDIIEAELAGLSVPEIAQRKGTSSNTIYKVTHDARVKLRRALEKEGWTNGSIQKTLDDKI